MLEKRKSHAFGKDIYLLGKDERGILYWLEAPSWDCGWYWGFGYIETYTRNSDPSRARDINTHEHWDGIIGQQWTYDYTHSEYVKGNFANHLNEVRRFSDTTLTESESWELSDLMKRFYTMKEMAEILHTGTAHLTSNTKHFTKQDEFLAWINEVELPALFKRVIEILSPME